MKPFLNIYIKKFYFSIGWFWGEQSKVFELSIGEVMRDFTSGKVNHVSILSFQIAKFCIHTGFTVQGFNMTTTIKFFNYTHLPPRLQEVVRPIAELARWMEEELPESPEKSTGMRKLLEAKDCFVRSVLEMEQNEKENN